MHSTFKSLPEKVPVFWQFSDILRERRPGTGYLAIFKKNHNSGLPSGICFLLHQFYTKIFQVFDAKAVKMY